MVTGDNVNTAMAIAKECGIYDPDFGVALEGPVFRAMSPAQVWKLTFGYNFAALRITCTYNKVHCSTEDGHVF